MAEKKPDLSNIPTLTKDLADLHQRVLKVDSQEVNKELSRRELLASFVANWRPPQSMGPLTETERLGKLKEMVTSAIIYDEFPTGVKVEVASPATVIAGRRNSASLRSSIAGVVTNWREELFANRSALEDLKGIIGGHLQVVEERINGIAHNIASTVGRRPMQREDIEAFEKMNPQDQAAFRKAFTAHAERNTPLTIYKSEIDRIAEARKVVDENEGIAKLRSQVAPYKVGNDADLVQFPLNLRELDKEVDRQIKGQGR